LRRVRAQIFQRYEFKRAHMSRREYDGRCASGFKSFLPSSDAQTPTITAFKTGKVKLRNRGAEIVTDRCAEAKELLGHHRANSVQPMIAGTGAAVAIAVEAGARLATTAFEFATQDVRELSHEWIVH
jgi:hypothetical protein